MYNDDGKHLQVRTNIGVPDTRPESIPRLAMTSLPSQLPVANPDFICSCIPTDTTSSLAFLTLHPSDCSPYDARSARDVSSYQRTPQEGPHDRPAHAGEIPQGYFHSVHPSSGRLLIETGAGMLGRVAVIGGSEKYV